MRARRLNLNRRLNRLSRVQFEKLLGDEASDQAPGFYDFLVRELGSDASLIKSLEFRPMVPPPPHAPLTRFAVKSSEAELESGSSGSGSDQPARVEEKESITIILPAPLGTEMRGLGEVEAELEISLVGEVHRKLIIHRINRMGPGGPSRSAALASAEQGLGRRREGEKALARMDLLKETGEPGAAPVR